jgi:hypothetical protein
VAGARNTAMEGGVVCVLIIGLVAFCVVTLPQLKSALRGAGPIALPQPIRVERRRQEPSL